jgi:YegS/Rv2252/BmrU family lipid kinase
MFRKALVMRVKVIINSQAVGDRRLRLQTVLERKFAGVLAGIEWTTHAGHALEIARRAKADTVDTLVAVGGDGTFNEVLNGVIGSDIRIGVIPFGTANDLASFYGIPGECAAACDVVLQGRQERLDVIKVNDWHLVTTGGVGLPCDALAAVQMMIRRQTLSKLLKAWLGHRLYLLGLLLVLVRRSRNQYQLHIKSGEQSIKVTGSSLIIGNLPFLGGNFHVLFQAGNNDGLFDICLLESHSRLGLMRMATRALNGKYPTGPGVRRFRTDRAVVASSEPLPFFGDGEIGIRSNTFRIQLLPAAVNFLVPKGKDGS